MKSALVFGASGALGSVICEQLRNHGYQVLTAGRGSSSGTDIDMSNPLWTTSLEGLPPLSGVVWAQGANASGTVLDDLNNETLRGMFEANVVFIAETVRQLVQSSLLEKPCRTVVLSSIWQDHARPRKFAYMVTKSALSGLVKSLAIDLADLGIAINAVLPGVVDTPMTRANLSQAQIDVFERSTPGGRLSQPTDVAKAVEFLLSEESEGMTGQFLTVDRGWSVNRSV